MRERENINIKFDEDDDGDANIEDWLFIIIVIFDILVAKKNKMFDWNRIF